MSKVTRGSFAPLLEPGLALAFGYTEAELDVAAARRRQEEIVDALYTLRHVPWTREMIDDMVMFPEWRAMMHAKLDAEEGK